MWHRKPVVAGSFYPSNRNELIQDIDKYLKDAEGQKLKGEVVAVISPHAGYVYSGPVAAYSFNHLKTITPEVVIVLAPSHRARFNGASVIPSGIYETPLGNVEIDESICEKLANEKLFGFIEEVESGEHSLEVQVPFLQRVLTGFKIVPVIIGTTDLDICNSIAGQIYNNIAQEKRKIVVVISTDLSHYHSYVTAREIDNVFIETLKTFDEEKVNTACRKKAEACGQGPVLAGMSLSKKMGADRVEILKYANSGDTAGGRREVVGYLAAAFLK